MVVMELGYWLWVAEGLADQVPVVVVVGPVDQVGVAEVHDGMRWVAAQEGQA